MDMATLPAVSAGQSSPAGCTMSPTYFQCMPSGSNFGVEQQQHQQQMPMHQNPSIGNSTMPANGTGPNVAAHPNQNGAMMLMQVMMVPVFVPQNNQQGSSPQPQSPQLMQATPGFGSPMNQPQQQQPQQQYQQLAQNNNNNNNMFCMNQMQNTQPHHHQQQQQQQQQPQQQQQQQQQHMQHMQQQQQMPVVMQNTNSNNQQQHQQQQMLQQQAPMQQHQHQQHQQMPGFMPYYQHQQQMQQPQMQQHMQMQMPSLSLGSTPLIPNHLVSSRSGSEASSTDVPSLAASDEDTITPSDRRVLPRSGSGRGCSGRMEAVVTHFQQATILKNFRGPGVVSADVEMQWPDLNFSLKGVDNVQNFVQALFEAIPDLDITIKTVSEDGCGHGFFEYLLAGTQLRPFYPMFPVGKRVQWRFTSRFEFDSNSQIRVHQLRFGLGPREAPNAAQFEGLAACASMLATTPGGSRLLQDALEMDPCGYKVYFVNPLRSHVWTVSQSPHGNHVLQKLISSLPAEEVQFAIDAFRGRAVEAAQGQMESRVLERVLEQCPANQTAELLDELLFQVNGLLRHPFGNFVLQAALEHGSPMHRTRLVRCIIEDADRLARHRISSNLVRKALRFSSPVDREMLAQTLAPDAQAMANLSRHKIGSFVARELKSLAKMQLPR